MRLSKVMIGYYIMILMLGIVLAIVAVGWLLIAVRVDWSKRRQPDYYEITLFLGSGGHTGELCQMLHNFKMDKVTLLNILITSTDKSSQNFFTNYIKSDHSQHQQQILTKTRFFQIKRTNQVKQSKLTSLFTTLRSLLSSFWLIVKHLMNTTHFISNGPGSSVPLFFLFFLLRTVKLCKAKLIFIQSWCRVHQLSLTGKIIRPIADDFIVHWPQLAAKYKGLKYYERMV